MKLISVSCFWGAGEQGWADPAFLFAILAKKSQENNLFCQNLVSIPIYVLLGYSFEHYQKTEMLCRGYNTNSQKLVGFPQIYIGI